jgi:FkbM family methyltransferase
MGRSSLRVNKESSDAYQVSMTRPVTLSAWIRKSPSSDVFVFFQVFISQGYEPLHEFLSSNAIEPRTAIDAGANVGYFTLWLTALYPEARVLCVEPVRSNYQQLLRNLAQGQVRTETVQSALWVNQDILQLENPSAEEWSYSLTTAIRPEYEECRGVTLSDLRMRLGRVDLLKLDIEGSEARLFKDSDFLNELRGIKVLAMEIHGESDNREWIESALTELGFEFCRAGELTMAINRN